MMKRFKKLICAGVAASMLLGTALSANALQYGEEWDSYYHASTTTYGDVSPSYWAYDAIMRTTEKNWFGGYPDGNFRPNNSITRAEALKVFVMFLGLELEDVTESSFYDVDTSVWYAPYIEAGKDLFPTHTTIQGKRPFNPDMPVTREDTIYALVKSLGCNVGVKYVDQSVLNMFNDQNSISGDVKAYFAIALSHELVSGYPDGTIRAQAALTRAEFATLLMRGTEHGFHDKYEAKIKSVTVSPSSPIEMTIGETLTLSARATYTDGTNQAYSNMQPYDENSNGVISVSGNTITALKEGTANIKYNSSDMKGITTTVTVKKPSAVPTLKITDYPDETSESSATVSGSVSDASGKSVELTCNGKDVSVQADGGFSTVVSLKDGENTIEFIAKNIYDAQTTKKIIIKKDGATSYGDESGEKEVDKSSKGTESKGTESKGTISSPDDPTSYLTFDKGTGTITDCGTSVESIVIPEKLDGVNVYYIGSEAFANCKYLEEIVLPSTLKGISEKAFSGCTKLLAIDIPEGTKSIGENAFENCSALTDVTIPSTVKKITGNMFLNCKRLKNVSLENGITVIGDNAFCGCKSLTELVVPETVTKISSAAFLDCGSLKMIEIPKTVTEIADNAFDGCNALTIYASVNSYAIEYAKEHGIAWEVI